MKVVLLEDEPIALSKLTMLLKSIDPKMEIVGHANSIEYALKIIAANDDIDLGFFDIQLIDGLSFKVFERMKVNFPVVFTTAYDEYAIKAFEHHSIGYILKPIRKKDLELVLGKFKDQWRPAGNDQLISVLNQFTQKKYKDRFTVKIGERIKIIDSANISAFYSRFKGSYIYTDSNNSYDLEPSLDAIEDLIDPKLFFRVNRKQIIALKAIKSINQHSSSRLKIELTGSFDEEIIVARERVKEFKNWLEGEI